MKDEHNYGEKMARNGGTKVIYKGTFISDRSLIGLIAHLVDVLGTFSPISGNFQTLILLIEDCTLQVLHAFFLFN